MKKLAITLFLLTVTLLFTPQLASAQTTCGSIVERFPSEGEEYVNEIEDCDNPFNLNDDPQFENIAVANSGVAIAENSVLTLSELPADLNPSVTYDRNLDEAFNPTGPVFEFFELYKHQGDDYVITYDSNYNSLGVESEGTYTLVVGLEEAPVLSWLDRVQSWLIPTAHAQSIGFVPGERFAITFTIELEEEVSGASSVLFLPGIQASRLYRERIIGTEDRIWEAQGNIDALDLRFNDSLNSVEEIYTRDVIDKFFVVSNVLNTPNIYNNLLESFSILESDQEIKEFLPFAYDWRYDVFHVATQDVAYANDEVKRLKGEIERMAAESYTGQVSVVAHSNGGLVLKALLDSYSDQAFVSKIDKVIMVGTPQLGAPKTIASLLHGYDQGIPLVVGPSVARQLALNFPGAYGLLPSDEYLLSGVSPTVFFDTSETTAQFRAEYGNAVNTPVELEAFLLGQDGREDADSIEDAALVNSALLTQSQTQAQTLTDFLMPESIGFYSVVGVGIETEIAFEYREFDERICRTEFLTQVCETETYYKPVPVMSPDGDGTVPAVSAGYDGVVHYVNLRGSEYDHKNLTEDSRILDFVTDVVLDEPFSVNDTPPDFVQLDLVLSDETLASNSTSMVIGIHSPMNIIVTDLEGNQSGLIGNDILTDIPNSSYRELAGSKYVIVPRDTDVSVEFAGQADGGATVTVDEFNVTGQESVAVIPVPVVASTTRSSFSITDTAVSNSETDIDGDGIVDETRTPDGELVEETTTNTIRFTARDIDRTLPGGDKRPELVADVYENGALTETIALANKIHWGGRVQEVITDAPIDVKGYKVNRTYTPMIGNLLDASVTSPQLHQDELRYNKGFGIDKSGKRKNEGFPGDEGAKDAKDLNWRELVLFNLSNYLINQSIVSVTLDVTPRRSQTFSGQLLVLDVNQTVIDIVPLIDLGAGTHSLDLTTHGTSIALNVTSGSVQVGVSLEVNN